MVDRVVLEALDESNEMRELECGGAGIRKQDGDSGFASESSVQAD